MKYVLLVLLLIGKTAWCQNLVPNPSFEEFSDCPFVNANIDQAVGWTSFGGTPDYFNSCANVSQPGLGTPQNSIGHQWPHSGNAYVGFLCFYGQGFVREYTGRQLSQPLIIGTRYYLSVFISRCDTFSYHGSVNNFGFRFSTIAYAENASVPTDNFSHVHGTSVVTDNVNWTKISGSFIADSVYGFVGLGNFYDNVNTDTINCPIYAYYFVDDVCVTDDSLFNESWTGVSNQPVRSNFSIYPNPSHQAVNLTLPQGTLQFEIFNAIGQSVHSINVTSLDQAVDVSLFSEGVYFVRVHSHQGVQTQKFVVH